MKAIYQTTSGKSVLCVPVYSMRSHEGDKLYDLTCDGNFSRVISIMSACPAESVTITVPRAEMLTSESLNLIAKCIRKYGLKFRQVDGYGANARETRLSPELGMSILRIIDDYNLAIIEPQITMVMCATELSCTTGLAYWCVASVTSAGTPWFVKDFAGLDKAIARRYLTFCASPTQVEYLGGKSVVAEFSNPAFFDKKTLFFPFRLSDKEYDVASLVKLIRQLNDDGLTDAFDVIITDPNDSAPEDLLELPNVVKVTSSHPVYLAILKGKPIIPYFGNVDMLRHVSLDEMVYYGCDIVCYTNETLAGLQNVSMNETFVQFCVTIKSMIMGDQRGA